MPKALGFPHATLLWEGPKPQTGIQAAARHARYRLMGEAMRANRIALLFTGHTRDDRAETLLMRLARGSGLDGLAGMAPRLHFQRSRFGDPAPDEQEIARPLLDVSKNPAARNARRREELPGSTIPAISRRSSNGRACVLRARISMSWD